MAKLSPPKALGEATAPLNREERYKQLALAIVDRARLDARSTGEMGREARAWLLTEAPELLALAGYSLQPSVFRARVEEFTPLKPAPMWQILFVAVIRKVVLYG